MAHQNINFQYSKAHGIPEPMNASSHHPKIKISVTPSDSVFLAGTHVTGRLEMECRAEGEKGLGIGVVMIELFAIQELTSRDHLATNTYLHSRRLFQGPGLPPSNAVLPSLSPSNDTTLLPQHYFPARRGRSIFFFRIPLPGTCPNSIAFAQGQAKVTYELRGSAGVFWKNERRLVVCRKRIDVIARFAIEDALVVDMQSGGTSLKVPEAFVVGEEGKIWMQGRIIGGLVVAGESACVELHVKNHSMKKNTSLTLFLTRTLYLPVPAAHNPNSPPHIQISDTLVTVPFRGPEYTIPPGAEGVANLVFDVPKEAKGVRGGMLDGEELEGEATGRLRITESLFEIRCKVEVKLTMGMGSKDIRLEIPIDVIHPKALPEEPNTILPTVPYVDQNQVWILPPPVPTGYAYATSPPIVSQPTGLGLTFGMNLPYLHTGTNHQIPPPMSSTPPHLYQYPQHPLHPPLHHLPPRPLSAEPIAMYPHSATQFPLMDLNPQPFTDMMSFSTDDVTYANDPFISPGAFPAGHESEHAYVDNVSPLSGPQSVPPISHNYTSLQTDYPAISAYHTRILPFPPLDLSSGVTQDESLQPTTAILHSPRPQLTPKHSLTRITDAYKAMSLKSEHVEELEKMADDVVRRSGNDLSGDVPKEMVEEMEEEIRKKAKGISAEDDEMLKRNKTLPGPPSIPLTLDGDLILHETEPLPSDQTPPTPTLHALVRRSRGRDKDKEKRELLQELRTENGLEALERRLLREVGTRKMNAPPRPDVRDALRSLVTSPLEPVKGSDVGADSPMKSTKSEPRAIPIPIPAKSPEPFNDSAISSLTLAGRMLEDLDDDQDSDGGKTHRAGSRSSVAGDDEGAEWMDDGGGDDDDHWGELRAAPRHTRERAEVLEGVGTPTRASQRADKVLTPIKEKPAVQRKKAKAKGRVTAWLGEIDVGVPPQEQIIPPSPSVVRAPQFLDAKDDDDDDGDDRKWDKDNVEPEEEEAEAAQQGGSTTAPNPRSSGFVPIASAAVNATTALNRNTIHFNLGLGPSSRPLVILRDATVVEEARRVQSLWNSGGAVGSNPEPEQAKIREERTTDTTGVLHKFFPPLPRVQSIRTDRRVSPPSNSAKEEEKLIFQQSQNRNLATGRGGYGTPSFTPTPMSYSAAAKSAVDNNNKGVGISLPKKLTYPTIISSASNESKPIIIDSEQQQPPPPPRFPIHPPPPLPKKIIKPTDPEIRYDVRSARGGRGGKVTTVANLWASGAIMNQGTSSGGSGSATPVGHGKGRDRARAGGGGGGGGDRWQMIREDRHAPAVVEPVGMKKKTVVVPAKVEKKSFSAALMSPAPPPPHLPPSQQQQQRGVITTTNKKPSFLTMTPLSKSPSTKHNVEAQKRADSRNVFAKHHQQAHIMTTTTSVKRSGTPSSVGGRTTPMAVMRSSPPTSGGGDGFGGGRGKPEKEGNPITAGPGPRMIGGGGVGGGLKPNNKPGIGPMIIPPSTNPASVVLSSSHAVPHLSSTASLARPPQKNIIINHTNVFSRNITTNNNENRYDYDYEPTSSPPHHHHLPTPPPPPQPAALSTPSLSPLIQQAAAPLRMFPPMMMKLSASKSTPSLHGGNSGSGSSPPPPRAGSPSKPMDLSFGQARLRDLIKKYQGT